MYCHPRAHGDSTRVASSPLFALSHHNASSDHGSDWRLCILHGSRLNINKPTLRLPAELINTTSQQSHTSLMGPVATVLRLASFSIQFRKRLKVEAGVDFVQRRSHRVRSNSTNIFQRERVLVSKLFQLQYHRISTSSGRRGAS